MNLQKSLSILKQTHQPLLNDVFTVVNKYLDIQNIQTESEDFIKKCIQYILFYNKHNIYSEQKITGMLIYNKYINTQECIDNGGDYKSKSHNICKFKLLPKNYKRSKSIIILNFKDSVLIPEWLRNCKAKIRNNKIKISNRLNSDMFAMKLDPIYFPIVYKSEWKYYSSHDQGSFEYTKYGTNYSTYYTIVETNNGKRVLKSKRNYVDISTDDIVKNIIIAKYSN